MSGSSLRFGTRVRAFHSVGSRSILPPPTSGKEGPSYDLSIALGILIAFGQLAADLDDALVIGELSLGGSLRHMTGVLLMIGLAKEQRLQRAFVPAVDAAEAALVEE